MNAESILKRRNELVSRFGPWTAHNIHLGSGVYTISREEGKPDGLRRIVRIVSDVSAKPIEQLRILDLACLEGLYAVELASRGAQVVGIEGRKEHVEKARFAKDVLALNNLEFIHDDVRNLTRAAHGSFDVVLCLGILYHLDAPDIFRFVERMAEVCRGFLIVDTHAGLTEEESRIYSNYYVPVHHYALGEPTAIEDDGRKYWGRLFAEHSDRATTEERLKKPWASLDNPKSFWLTRPSLYNLLSHSGFTSIYECHTPAEPEKPLDRITLLAIKGDHGSTNHEQEVDEQHTDDWAEERLRPLSATTRIGNSLTAAKKKAVGALPEPIKDALRGLLKRK